MTIKTEFGLFNNLIVNRKKHNEPYDNIVYLTINI